MAKAFALLDRDLKNEVEVREFIWTELLKVKEKLKGSRIMYAVVPELERAM